MSDEIKKAADAMADAITSAMQHGVHLTANIVNSHDAYLRTRLSPEPAAPDAGVEETVERLCGCSWLMQMPGRGFIVECDRVRMRAILAAHTASLRRELDLTSGECLAIKDLCTTHLLERDAARTDLEAAVGLLKKARHYIPHSGLGMVVEIDQFLARKEAAK